MSKLIIPGEAVERSRKLYGPSGEVITDLDENSAQKERTKLRKFGRSSIRFTGRVVTAAVCGIVFGFVAVGVGWRELEDRAESSQIGQEFVSDLQSAAEEEDLEDWFLGLVADSGITLERVAEVMAENQQVELTEQAEAIPETETTILNDEMLETFSERISNPQFRQYFTETIEDPETEPEEIADLMFGPLDQSSQD